MFEALVFVCVFDDMLAFEAFVVVVVVVVVVVEFAFDVTLELKFVFARLAFVLLALLLVVSPHPKPSAPRAKTVESAIAFFIANYFSCLLQRLNYTYLQRRSPLHGAVPSEVVVEQWPI
jgi:hypothetical protein